MNKFKNIFKKDRNIIIGAVHLAPLLGFKDFPGYKLMLKNALADLKALEAGGVDGIIYENNYDLPHHVNVQTSQSVSMAYMADKLRAATNMPIGASVIWNDYETALALASTYNLQFIRIPVFVDKVRTNYGEVTGNPKQVQATVKKFKAEKVALFTDIHVKHAKLLSKSNIVDSAKKAKISGSDAVILTGNWTGDAPNIDELKLVRKHIGNFPILLGSGVDSNNIGALFKYANGAIISTSLKADSGVKHKVNIKPYSSRISLLKVIKLKKSI